MEPIKVNTDVLNSRIQSEVKECINAIVSNAKKGTSVTELYVPVDIHSDIRSEIERQLKESGTRYVFLTVRRGTNQYTGKAESYSGTTIGNERYWKVEIY